jgi:predicted methyltransferase
MKLHRLSLALVIALAACNPAEPPAEQQAAEPAAAAPAPAAPVAPPASAVDTVIAGEHRSAENRARDQYRHPAETLAFFGFAPGQTVVEITPGAGWYAEILAPALNTDGRYIAVVMDPAKAGSEGAQKYYAEGNQKLRDKFAANPELYGNATIVEVDPAAPVIGEPGQADLVLTFRNVHNWMGQDQAAGMFKAFFDALKPGGVLGVVEHRAAEGSAANPDSGYVSEQAVIELATAAGFELAEKSEINANPADTKDHPNGVWTLPPSSRVPEGEDPARYQAIGESDRMTLKFVKPGGEAAASDAAAPAAEGAAPPADADQPAAGDGAG